MLCDSSSAEINFYLINLCILYIADFYILHIEQTHVERWGAGVEYHFQEIS